MLLDLVQVENLLLSSEGYIRLCDFGSATTSSYYPDHTWTAVQRSMVEDEASLLCFFYLEFHRSLQSIFSMSANFLRKSFTYLLRGTNSRPHDWG